MKWMCILVLGLAAVLPLSAEDSAPAPQYGYLVERIKVPTDDGVVGFAAGTRLLIVSQKGGKAVVKVGTRQFTIEAIQMTTDQEKADAVLAKEAAAKKAADKDLKEKNQEAAVAAAAATPAGGTVGDKLRALEKQAILVHGQMQETFSAMMATPHKLKPRTPDEYANNSKRDELKAKHAELETQYKRILEEERLLRHETR